MGMYRGVEIDMDQTTIDMYDTDAMGGVGRQYLDNMLNVVKKVKREESIDEAIATSRERSDQLFDPQSEYYQSFRKNLLTDLTRSISATAPTTQNLLAMSVGAGGRSYGGAQAVAQEQREATEARNRDTISRGVERGVTNLYQSNIGQSTNLLGMGISGMQGQQQLAFQQQQLQAQIDAQPSFFEGLLGGAASAASYGIGQSDWFKNLF